MNQREMETAIKNIDERTARIEQILPTLATKEDLKGFPRADDPKGFATKEDLKAFATKEDLKAFATKDDLKAFATKEDLKAFPTREEMMAIVREEGERTRVHFDVVAEAMKADIKAIAEGMQ